MKNRSLRTNIAEAIPVLLVLIICNIYMCAYKLHLGTYFDEVTYVATGDMFRRGAIFLKDNWYILQFIAVFMTPIVRCYEAVNGSLEGVVFFVRVVFILIQSLVAFLSYLEFKHHVSNRTATIAAIVIYSYVPYMYSIHYRTVANWCLLGCVVLLLSFYRKPAFWKSVLLGLFISGASVAFETAAIVIIPVSIALIQLCRDKDSSKRDIRLHLFLIWGICICCASCLLAPTIIEEGWTGFITDFRHFFDSETHTENILQKLPRMLPPLFLAFVGGWLAEFLFDKIQKKRAVRYDGFIAVILSLLVAIFIILRPQSVTISRVNYWMLFIFFLTIFMVRRLDKQVQFIYLNIFLLPTIFFMAAIMMATNLGIAVVGCACIISLVFLILISDQRFLNLRTTSLVIPIVMISASCLLVMNTFGATTVFARYSPIISSGSMKGTQTSSEYEYDLIVNTEKVVKKYVKENDSLFLYVRWANPSGYLDGDERIYATPSVEGYFNHKGTIVPDFFLGNARRRPTIAIINTDDLPCAIDEYLSDYPLGQYIRRCKTEETIDNGYAVFRLKTDM